MKRYIKASTFYVTRIDDPYNSIATLPGFSLEEASNYVQKYNGDVIPLTGEERKKLLRACNNVEPYECQEVYESMKDSFIYNKYMSGDADSKISYSFWITSAFDTRSTVFAVGADIAGSYEFNLNKIAKKLGDKNFYHYSTGRGKRLKNFSTLIQILKDSGVNEINFTKEDLIDACNEDRYYILRS